MVPVAAEKVSLALLNPTPSQYLPFTVLLAVDVAWIETLTLATPDRASLAVPQIS